MKLYKNEGFLYYEDGDEKFWGSQEDLQLKPEGLDSVVIWFFQNRGREHKTFAEGTFLITEVEDADGNSYGDTIDDIINGIVNGGKSEVFLSDQTTDPIIASFNQVHDSTTLSVAASIDDQTITLTSVTGVVDNSYIILFDPISVRFSTFRAIGSPSGNIVTLDTPIDFAYPIGTFVDIAITDMSVNGLVTPQVFGLRGTGAPPGVDLSFDVTRIMIGCTTDTAVDLAKFGDLAALTNGLVLRKRDGRYKNIFNIKTNGGIALQCYDWTPYSATNPNQGQDGFVSRLTFAGQGKLGVAIRLPIGEDLEFIIQDDLTGILRFEVVAEGHIVD